MNVTLLIDAIVRQTTVLIAHLATAAGVRAPLAHLANQVFYELVRELEAQGLGRRVVADMFGIALRSYQLKVRRIAESVSVRDRSLWEAVYGFVQQARVVRRLRIFERFAHDDESQVRAVLHDLVESGLVYRTGRGRATVYRVADPGELEAEHGGEDFAAFVWAVIYREGPIAADDLSERFAGAELAPALAALAAEGRIERAPGEGERWQAGRFVVPLDSQSGWEAAIFDHFQAMVAAMCAKLAAGRTRSGRGDRQGGSTWSFDVWPGHPHEANVYGLLDRLRAEVGALRDAVAAHNTEHPRPPDAARVTLYMGQGVVEGGPEHEEAP